MILSYFIRGFVVALSLIVAIGAQNAYVLKQGLRRNHVWLIVNICVAADILVFAMGAVSISWIEAFFPRISIFIYMGGALFLFVYGAISFFSIRNEKGLEVSSKSNGEESEAMTKEEISRNKAQTIFTLLAVTFLNPHFYIDTFFIVGAQVAFLKGTEKLFFFLGCCSASFTWFYVLGYGSRMLSPLFAKPLTWKVLNFLIGVLMWAMGYFFTLEFLAEWERLSG